MITEAKQFSKKIIWNLFYHNSNSFIGLTYYKCDILMNLGEQPSWHVCYNIFTLACAQKGSVPDTYLWKKSLWIQWSSHFRFLCAFSVGEGWRLEKLGVSAQGPSWSFGDSLSIANLRVCWLWEAPLGGRMLVQPAVVWESSKGFTLDYFYRIARRCPLVIVSHPGHNLSRYLSLKIW